MGERGKHRRSSALWGTGGKQGDQRSSALWGRGGRGASILLATVALALAVPAAALSGGGSAPGQAKAVVPQSLLNAAQANPTQSFRVIVQGTRGRSSQDVLRDVSGQGGHAKHAFFSINGVSADLTGRQVLVLAKLPFIRVITPDIPMRPSTYQDGQMWPSSVDLAPVQGTATNPAPAGPAIAIIDSGIDTTRTADFGTRVVASVNFCSTCTDGAVDDEGHGTLVAGLAAGASTTYVGAAPNAPLVNLRTANGQGESYESDVVSACDWVLQNKQAYNIGVANLSMAGNTDVSFQNDPLDQAVEKLWLNGVVVVAAAGNSGTGTGAVDVSYAPGNDPFVIDVGAADQAQTSATADDSIAPWSSYGTTVDGFSRPDVSAPGRYLIGPVTDGTYIATNVPDREVAPGYFWMSGTSLAAPVVSGAAELILAQHPTWTPDQVKGALMATANALPLDTVFAGGVGEVDAGAAAAMTDPPNPNSGLEQFVTTDPTTGLASFDAASWETYVGANPTWEQSNWSSVSWTGVSWNSVSWTGVSWNSVSWTSGTASATTSTDVSWNSVSWTGVSWIE